MDYPDGIPTPRISETPLFECGAASGARDVVPGAKLTFTAENPTGGGGFDPPVVLGTVNNSGAAQSVGINPPFVLRARISVQYEICSDVSPRSDIEIVQPEPATIPAPTLDDVYENADVVVVRNIVNGATLSVFANGVQVGGQATSGGTGQVVGLNPVAQAGDVFTASQKLCTAGPVSAGVNVKPCSELPPAKIKAPEAGDTHIDVTEFVTGSRILIFANGVEIGDGGGHLIELYRPLRDGETVTVLQRLGNCESSFVYVIEVECKIAETISNPSATGPYRIGSLEYQLPAVTIGGDLARIWATMRYPAESDGNDTPLATTKSGFPIVMVLHGNHGVLRGPDDPIDPNNIADDVCSGSGLPEVNNHAGYDYVLESLARGGMIAVSINANDLNCLRDRINERADLILQHLDLWKGLNAGTAPTDPFNGKFQGGVDLTRIGLLGHSRGGEAVVRVPLRNRDSSLVIKGILSLAPTDGEVNNRVNDIPLLMVLPAADGDVSNNAGARIYDRSLSSTSGWFRSQMYIYGANHNYFNQEWLEDDCLYDFDDCTPSIPGIPTAPARLSRSAQEAMLEGWSRTFFDLTLNGRSEYLTVFSGDTLLSGLNHDAVFTSYLSARRKLLDHYQDSPDNIDLNSLNGQVIRNGAFLGFDEYTLGEGASDRFNDTFFHDTDGLVTEWQRDPPSFTSQVPAADQDVSAFDFSIRVAQVNDSADGKLNDASRAMVIRLGVSDSSGHIDIESSELGTIPFPYQHPFGAKSMMHTLRLPRACFVKPNGDKVDFSAVTDVSVNFDRTEQGTLAIDDLGFSQ